MEYSVCTCRCTNESLTEVSSAEDDHRRGGRHGRRTASHPALLPTGSDTFGGGVSAASAWRSRSQTVTAPAASTATATISAVRTLSTYAAFPASTVLLTSVCFSAAM